MRNPTARRSFLPNICPVSTYDGRMTQKKPNFVRSVYAENPLYYI